MLPCIATAQTLYGPSHYYQFSDSPFAGGSYSSFYLEDFEDGVLNVPDVVATGLVPPAVIGPTSVTDSVDGDDGTIDGLGRAGYSLFAAFGDSGITFTFSDATLGSLPTVAGIVWTDGNNSISFEARDLGGNVIASSLNNSHADNSIFGETDEDRFYGVAYSGGIKSITIWSGPGGIEVDHLQYGIGTPNPVPEPMTLLLGGASLAAAFRKRSR